MERGRTYTFLVYGGDDPTNAANYHPFYITDSVNGGRLLNTEEQQAVKNNNDCVFAEFECLKSSFLMLFSLKLYTLDLTMKCQQEVRMKQNTQYIHNPIY